MTEKLEVCVPGKRAEFEKWMAERGGVLHWPSVNLSNLGMCWYSPAKTEDGEDFPKPSWQAGAPTLYTDINDFRFCKEQEEVDRFRVAVRHGSSNPMLLKLTDASGERLRKRKAKAEKKHGDIIHVFDYDTQEAVILKLVWEEDPVSV